MITTVGMTTMTESSQIVITIPKYEDKIMLVKARRPKYKKDSKGEKVLSNPRTVGKAKYWVVNGQSIYSGTLHPKARAKVINSLKEYVKSFIPKDTKIPSSWLGHLKISIKLYDLMPNSRHWDCDNKWPWIKAATDCLTDLDIIPDDNVTYVKSNGEIIFIPVETTEERKLEIIISRL